MPQLPPPPPPPMSLADALVDLVRRHRPGWMSPRAGVVAAVVAAAILATTALAVRAGTVGRPPELTLPMAGTADGPRTSEGDPSSATGDPSSATVAVHAAGAFARPGLYELPAGSRVARLVEAAGGPAPGAVLDALNLAARLVDGERIFLPAAPGAVDPHGPAGSPQPTAGHGKLDLNTATADQLETLPGIGPATAKAIVDHRETQGRFRTVDDLLAVRGIGAAKLDALRELVRV